MSRYIFLPFVFVLLYCKNETRPQANLLINKHKGAAQNTLDLEKGDRRMKRGINVKPFIYDQKSDSSGRWISEDEFVLLSKWNVSLLRVNLFLDKRSSWYNSSRKKNKKVEDPQLNSIEESLAKTYGKNLSGLDSIAKYCKKYNIDFMPAFHGIKGRYDGKEITNHIVSLANFLHNRYQDNDNFWGYDILNEPNTEMEKQEFYTRIAPRIVGEIRKFDDTRKIILESTQNAEPVGFNEIIPIEDENVVYSFHFYIPHHFTYQDIRGFKRKEPVRYPGRIKSEYGLGKIRYDKAQLQSELLPVIEFQKKTNAQILVGEFSAVRWAPGAEDYLKDAIEIFEENGWSWCYHSYFSGWNGFNPTFEPQHDEEYGFNGKSETARLKVLKEYWKRNNQSKN